MNIYQQPLLTQIKTFIHQVIQFNEPGFCLAYPPQGGITLHTYSKRAIAWETHLSFMAYQWPFVIHSLKQRIEYLTSEERLLLEVWNAGVQHQSWSITVFEVWHQRRNPILYGLPEDAAYQDACLEQMIQQFNALVKAYRQRLRQYQADQQKQQQDQARRNLQSATQYVDALRQRYARLLVVRVDLGYRSAALASINLYDLSQARKRYFKHLKEQAGLGHLVGYVWVIEEGDDKGLHLHGLFFFDGSQSRQDISLGQLLGEHWMHFTQGAGCYFNVNAEDSKHRLRNWQQTESYQTFMEDCFPGQGQYLQMQVLQAQASGQNSLAVGMIEHHNEAAWINIHLQLHYFTKLEQRIPLGHRGGIRCFGKGLLPAPPAKSGRPRSA